MVEFQSDIIEYIHKLCRKFAEENLSEEIIFFDGIWDVYEAQLRKWLKKPSKRLRLKLKKRRILRWIGMAEDGHVLDLELPGSLRVIMESLFDAAKTGELSQEKAKGLVLKYGKKLSDDLLRRVEEYLVPIFLNASNTIRATLRLILEIDEGKIPSPLESGKELVEEKKEYVIYSHEYPLLKYPEGKELSRKEFSEEKKKIKNEFGKYIIIIDEISRRIVIAGTSKYKITRSQKMFLKLLIKKADFPVEYETIIRAISRVGKDENYKWEWVDNYIAHRCFTGLHKKTEKKLERYIINVEGVGYKLNTEENPKYCLIEPLE